MIKIFPKSRVCAIDAYPSIEKGLKSALMFANVYNIPLSSNDGKKLLYSFCLKELQNDYTNTQSQYNKVFFVSKTINNKKLLNFINNYFEGIIKKSSIPYCGRHNAESPDLETAAQNCSNKHSSFTSSKFKDFLTNIKISYKSSL